ncbi:hypothetical protein FJ364_03835 [Candidatus Dependentiae bacterium]|nr:hypothetical protein [Candidatus Dependentiae bacterium]
MKKFLTTTLCALSISLSTHAIVKDASEVFKRWIQIQQIIPDCSFKDLPSEINEQFVQDFKTSYEMQIAVLNKQLPFLKTFSNGCINDYGYQISVPLNEIFEQNIKTFYELADTDISNLLDLLENFELFDNAPTNNASNNLVEQFNGVTQLFFSGHSDSRKVEFMFNLANRYAEWVFGDKFSENMQRLFTDSSKHQVIRYLYSVIWQKLAGHGWKNWHQGSLTNLAREAAQGKTVVYIAGGSDLYQLIKSGVYNIINIDPQLPTQPTYYTNDWEYILLGNVNDQIIFNDSSKKIVMVRKSFNRTGKQFKAVLANNQTVVIDESETVWDIYDTTNETKKVGNYTLKRRYCNQNDFNLRDNEVMLMSFNELHYICQPQSLGTSAPGNQGWGIDIATLSPSFKIYVKQLRNPLTRSTLTNMHMATLLNSIDLGYISLGSCIN